MVSTPEPVNPPATQEKQKERRTGIVKQVLSGDAVVIRGVPRGGPPPEFTLFFSSVAAPKLARRANPKDSSSESDDEPYAWEAREFLRKKVVGKEVICLIDHKVPQTGREYGTLWLAQDGQQTENLLDTMVSEGWLEVKKSGVYQDDRYNTLIELEQSAKSAGRGRWSSDEPNLHKRQITWNFDDIKSFTEKNKNQSLKGIVEFVRDACTLRVTLLPEFIPAMVALTGIRGPSFKQDGTKDEYADEAKFFTESRLLHRDVEVIIEGVNNQLIMGSIIHPAGSITEALLRQGFARCVDWNIGSYSQGSSKLREAEKEAKEKKVKVWKNYEATASNIREDERHFTAKVVEINNADAITVKTASGQYKKVFLAGVRPPKMPTDGGEQTAGQQPKDKRSRPIYDIPYMFEAREYLRKKLIGQKVDVTLDYIQPARADTSEKFPERQCCTVKIGDTIVNEAMIAKGLASIVFYRQDDEQRPSCYDALLAADSKAQTAKKGIHSKKNTVTVRVSDVSNDTAKCKAFLPSFQRTGKQDAVVEYVGSGSRFRVYLPKNSCLVSVILAGVVCPKGSRQGPNGQILEAEPWGNEAQQFSKELCLQRDVQVEIDAMDKVGNFIGWVYVDGKNVSLELVEAGFASVNYYSAERSPHLGVLQKAEAAAKEKKLKIWTDYVESTEVEVKQDEDTSDRSENYKRVMVVEILPGLHFFAQECDSAPKLESLMNSIREEFTSNPPLGGSYTPKRGDICAAKFSVDGQWYRAKVEGVQGGKVQVLFIDYGNRENVRPNEVANLPVGFKQLPAQAVEYTLAFVREPSEGSEAEWAFQQAVKDQPMLLNVEYKANNSDHVTLLRTDTKDDIGKGLVTDGYCFVDVRRERRLQKLVSEYQAAQQVAKRSRQNIWLYGDCTEDDAKEFGFGGR